MATGIERARATDAAIGVALIDIDNFRLLNETYGHDAGNEALLTVAGVLRRSLPDDVAFGRYGPDEFLLVAPAGSVHLMIDVLERMRAVLVDHSLQFDASERLPLTVSAGRVPVPRSRRLRDGAPDGHGPDPPGGEGRAAATRSGSPAGRSRASPGRARSTSSRA